MCFCSLHRLQQQSTACYFDKRYNKIPPETISFSTLRSSVYSLLNCVKSSPLGSPLVSAFLIWHLTSVQPQLHNHFSSFPKWKPKHLRLFHQEMMSRYQLKNGETNGSRQRCGDSEIKRYSLLTNTLEKVLPRWIGFYVKVWNLMNPEP